MDYQIIIENAEKNLQEVETRYKSSQRTLKEDDLNILNSSLADVILIAFDKSLSKKLSEKNMKTRDRLLTYLSSFDNSGVKKMEGDLYDKTFEKVEEVMEDGKNPGDVLIV